MSKNGIYSLEEILPMEKMESILQQFCTATKLITIISDFRGNMLCKGKNSNYYCPFCNYTRLSGNSTYDSLCERSDSIGGLEAARTGKPYIYRCHMGLVEISAPILVNNVYLGSLFMGQVRTDPEMMEKLPQVFNSLPLLDQDPTAKELWQESFASATVIPFEQLQAYGNLMGYIANLITQLALNQTIQDKLNDAQIRTLKEQNDMTSLEKHNAYLHLKNLQMRMHPHFLFNTLDVINGLAILEDAPQTSEAITSLANTFRLALGSDSILVSLDREMECVNGYLQIQKFFFENRVEFEVDVKEDCMGALVPSFAIQMLIENACVHGFANVRSNGHLRLAIERLGDYLYINVTDNGKGIDSMTANRLNNLNAKRNLENSLPESGLFSLITTLQLNYEGNCNWKVKRLPAGGTFIQLILPYRTENQ